MEIHLLESLVAGYRAILEAQDGDLAKLTAYLNRKPDEDILDENGYLTTTKKDTTTSSMPGRSTTTGPCTSLARRSIRK